MCTPLLAGVRLQRAKPTREPGVPGSSLRLVTTPPLFPGALPPALNTCQTQITSGDDEFRRNRRQMLEKDETKDPLQRRVKREKLQRMVLFAESPECRVGTVLARLEDVP